jgi:hypothetical protein
MVLTRQEVDMKRVIISILLLLFCLKAPAFAVHDHARGPEPTKHYPGSLFKMTDKGLFSVEMLIKGKELTTGVNAAELIIHDRGDRDVVGAEITVTPWMPEHGHGVFEKPVVSERGGGLYSVENILLIMSGRWELRMKVKAGSLEDGTVFEFPDVKVSSEAGHKHVSRAPGRPDMDTSRTRFSDKGIFKVTYIPDSDPVPVNRMSTWRLKIETAGGEPAGKAEIKIAGDMPEHGHGLPTEPAVTRELEAGQYFVEGLKFSMPGWWMMTFRIRSGMKEDSVTFNLILE